VGGHAGRGHARDSAFREFYVARVSGLRATAYLLCGDWHLAEDLVQAAFTKLYLAWQRVQAYEHLDQYVRRILVRTFLSERRRASRREHPVDQVPDAGLSGWMGGLDTGADRGAEERLILLAALAVLPPRQRAVLVLRFWEDLSVGQTAELLRVSTGSVKTHTSRGLATLRVHLGDLNVLAAEAAL